RVGRAPSMGALPLPQLAQYRLQDAAVAVVLHFHRRVDAGDGPEREFRPIRPYRPHDHLPARAPVPQAFDVEHLFAGQAQGLAALAGHELERQHAHTHQVAAMDALKALRDYGPHAQQERALGGPVARAARTVLLARDDEDGDPRLL